MALRASNDEVNSPVLGLSYYWQDPEKPPIYDWDQWIQLLEVAVLAKHSIAIFELFQEPTEQNSRNIAMMGNLQVDAAQKKQVSLLYISVGSRGRKTLMEKFPHI